MSNKTTKKTLSRIHLHFFIRFNLYLIHTVNTIKFCFSLILFLYLTTAARQTKHLTSSLFHFYVSYIVFICATAHNLIICPKLRSTVRAPDWTGVISVWSLHVISLSSWVYGFSSFLPHLKDIQDMLIEDSKWSLP